jgi:hypothetical protein
VTSVRSFAPILLVLAIGSARADDDHLLPHPHRAWWLSGQINVINQFHGRFHSPYSGPNSLRAEPEDRTSVVATLFAGLRVTPITELLVDLESAGGGGVSDALGLAGFTNLDVVRNPTLGAAPYLARAELHQIVPLGARREPAERGPRNGFAELPARRLELSAGKLSSADFFDLSGPASDSHRQFMNWTVDNNGAWDYAADTRGYTLGAVLGYHDGPWTVRFGELAMPKVANGIDYDPDVLYARGENLEGQLAQRWLPGRAGSLRLLLYLNHARMGSYDEATRAFLDGHDPRPDITAHRARGRTKYGFALGAEQELTASLRGFLRLGWNDGANESFAYTEVDDTVELGGDLAGRAWCRPEDRVGLALVTNGLSAPHRRYLELGGLGFLLGDGALHSGRETIIESYYTASVWRGISVAADLQLVVNPGYNQDRGPVAVGALRLHLEL